MLKLQTLVLSGLILVFSFSSAPAIPSPTHQVQETVDQVIEVLRDLNLKGDARRETLSRLIRKRFDFTIMSQRTLGKYWNEGSAEDQKRFVVLFSDLLEESYIGRIEAYTNETISYTGERIKGDRAEVATRVRNGNLDVQINYRMVLLNDSWFVYDVIIEEVSLIKNYRSSYGEIVRNEGFSGLFSRMEAKIEELRNRPPVSG
ncbi:MAG: ABC transporter substrate-binding protein [Deltaproteobacteria bacterium]|jgi:phospholipid transport system substrate-binding protein|nr:ABC transporter substrate-binding protein [Deltaproteobacteria bacterium]MBW2505294.1 ABC transporter substrate-binding protein [Deltaproteobacteria bacterium]MBW2519146.1 ABC transporter substrate-binding protein [Deltaproteobacteria bacterium]